MGRRKKVRTEPVRPICPQCEKQFSNQSALTKHKLTHSDERKFACQQCSKAFKRHDHLTGHMQTHSNRKPFNCTIQGCDKTYCDARSLRRHKENIHHIVTLKDNSSNNNSSSSINNTKTTNAICNTNTNTQTHDQNNNNTNHNSYDSSGHHSNASMPTTLPTSHQPASQPSHLLSRRIQRLQHQQQPHAYPVDYAPAQHFSIDFSNPPPVNTTNANLDQQFCHNGSVPHSADSINDSSLGLSTYYEQITPNSAPYDQYQSCSGYVTQTKSHYSSNHHHHHQQPHAYSADYASTQHFSFDLSNLPVSTTTSEQQICQNVTAPHSADSVNADSSLGLSSYHEQVTPSSAPYNQYQGCSGYVNQTKNHYGNNHQQQQPHAYSAGYASTQHFSFDIIPPVTATSDQQICQNGTAPQSVENINDSSLGLSTYYEQITPNSAHHDQYQDCGGYITPTTLRPVAQTLAHNQNHG